MVDSRSLPVRYSQARSRDVQSDHNELDLDTNLETYLIEEYSNEEQPSDGEVYRKMRQYKDNYIFRQRWQSWLKKTRAKDMNTLLRNEELTEAFDSLLPIYGIWDGMRLTTIHKIIPMRCPEVRMKLNFAYKLILP
ncbi:MAG: hypothetical protein CL912_03475 [Deltaproteobacteria bacterium]|nr:hypothetical protein [Deltaproteobacteria bacterium]